MTVEGKTDLDENQDVREAGLNALGTIGLPWVESAQGEIIRGLEDTSSIVRAMAAWAIGKIGPDIANRAAIDRLLRLLKDSFWKVRTAACITIGALGPGFVEIALDILLDALKNGTINRVIVCETVIKMGPDGERILVEILKRMRVKDAKLICPILASLELVDISKPSVDFVFEELFNCVSKGTNQVKKASLETLLRLVQRYGENELPSYFTFANLQPLVEKCLKEPAQDIRDLCLEFVTSFPQEERLFLVNSATESKDHIVRSEAMRGLARFGVQYLRILLYGLSDPSDAVRR